MSYNRCESSDALQLPIMSLLGHRSHSVNLSERDGYATQMDETKCLSTWRSYRTTSRRKASSWATGRSTFPRRIERGSIGAESAAQALGRRRFDLGVACAGGVTNLRQGNPRQSACCGCSPRG